MKPFDLEAAKAGKPVQDRQGNPVRIKCFDKIGGEYPIVALVKKKTNSGYEEVICSYTIDGRYYSDRPIEHEYDLVMAPEKKEGWINVYEGYQTSSVIFHTEQEAKSAASHYVVATIQIEWKEWEE